MNEFSNAANIHHFVWAIEWGGQPPVFGYDFADILAEGILIGIEDQDFLALFGDYCERCGEFRICSVVSVDEQTPTDRGTEHRSMNYKLCDACFRNIF